MASTLTRSATSSSQSLSSAELIRRFIPFLSPYRRWVVMAVVALLFTAALSLGLGQGIKRVIDQGISAASNQGLIESLSFFALLIIALAVGSFVRFYTVSWLGERVAADLRLAVFRHLLRLQPNYFEDNHSGDIMSRLTTDTTLLQTIIGSSLSFALRNSLTVIGGLVMLLVSNAKLTLVVLLGVPLVLIPVLWMGRRVRRLSRESQDSVADLGSYAGEVLRHIKTVQAYRRESFEQSAFKGEVDTAFSVARQRIFQRAVLMVTVLILAFGVIAVMVYIGAQDVIQGDMSPGALAAFVFYAAMVAFGVAGVAEVYGQLQRAAGAAERLFELLDQTSLIISPAKPMPLQPDAAVAHLTLSEVAFSYPSRVDKPAINGLSLSVRAGETLALVGPSGAGKSTLFELILRFYDPSAGQISLYGTPLEALSLAELRGQMAWVEQQPMLFSGSVARNIRYGRPEASDDALRTAAKQAHALEFILDLPQQFDTELGEGGVRLSGGQKQRIALARAMLNDPELLLLDEATSALDAQSEQAVQQALDELMSTRTTLIIAHRLSTVINADRIAVIDQGQVVGLGTHAQLLQSSALYQQLARVQLTQAP